MSREAAKRSREPSKKHLLMVHVSALAFLFRPFDARRQLGMTHPSCLFAVPLLFHPTAIGYTMLGCGEVSRRVRFVRSRTWANLYRCSVSKDAYRPVSFWSRMEFYSWFHVSPAFPTRRLLIARVDDLCINRSRYPPTKPWLHMEFRIPMLELPDAIAPEWNYANRASNCWQFPLGFHPWNSRSDVQLS